MSPTRTSQAVACRNSVLGDLEQEVAADVVQPEVVQGLQDRQEADAVARQVRIRRPQDERLVPLIGAIVEERRGLGVGPCNDDARDPHDVELEARGVEPLVLLVLADENLAGLVAALLGARLLVLDVVARARPTSTNRRIRFRTCASPPWPVSASAMMNGRKSTSGDDRRCLLVHLGCGRNAGSCRRSAAPEPGRPPRRGPG